MKNIRQGICWLVLLLAPSGLWADQVEVVEVAVRLTGPSTYAFAVTLRHSDTGWKHYADQWQIVAPDGTVLGTRVLYHPHEDEQPFTRSLSDVRVPAGVRQVTLRGHDNIHGWGRAVKSVALPQDK